MGRIRTIKPEFFLHEELFDLEEECGLPVRIAFAGLWCQADREGRFKWQPRRLKTQILPYDSIDFSRVLDALTTRGFVEKYRVNDAYFGVIPSFSEHQVVNNRERASALPDPSNHAGCDASPTRADASPTPLVHALVEGKGREQDKGLKSSRFKKPTLEEVTAYCSERGNSVIPGAFIDHYSSNGWRVGKSPMKDWKAAVRQWERRRNEQPSSAEESCL